MTRDRSKRGLSPKLALLLAAPHTWPASIFPVFLAGCLCIARGYTISIISLFVLLAISVLMQSAVNTINDYFDFVKGADTKDDNVDPSDAVLLYNDVRPTSARNFAIGCIICAFILGTYCIYIAGWIPLVIALVGVITVVLYSGGKTPISYLPISEFVSGFVMGELITLASWVVLTQTLDWLVLIWSIPLFIAIGLLMLTNNTCDIEKDIEANRKTLSVLLGRPKTRNLYHAGIIAWYISYITIVAIWFSNGAFIIPFALLITYPQTKALWSNPLTPNTRIQAMGQATNLQISMGSFFIASVLASSASLAII